MFCHLYLKHIDGAIERCTPHYQRPSLNQKDIDRVSQGLIIHVCIYMTACVPRVNYTCVYLYDCMCIVYIKTVFVKKKQEHFSNHYYCYIYTILLFIIIIVLYIYLLTLGAHARGLQ